MDDLNPSENLAGRVCMCQGLDGLDLVMSCNWEYRICLECLMSEDTWTVNELRGFSWQCMFDNHVGRGKVGV